MNCKKNIQHPTTEYSAPFGWKTKDSNIFYFSILPTHMLRNYKSYSLPNICPMSKYNGMKSKKCLYNFVWKQLLEEIKCEA